MDERTTRRAITIALLVIGGSILTWHLVPSTTLERDASAPFVVPADKPHASTHQWDFTFRLHAPAFAYRLDPELQWSIRGEPAEGSARDGRLTVTIDLLINGELADRERIHLGAFGGGIGSRGPVEFDRSALKAGDNHVAFVLTLENERAPELVGTWTVAVDHARVTVGPRLGNLQEGVVSWFAWP